MRFYQTKIFVAMSIILCLSPIVFTPFIVNALNDSQPSDGLAVNVGARMLLNVEGELEPGFSENEHLVYMKAGKEYVIRVTFDANCQGMYHMRINYIGEDFKFGNMVAENFNLSNLALKGLVKRSNKFCYKGLKLSRKE